MNQVSAIEQNPLPRNVTLVCCLLTCIPSGEILSSAMHRINFAHSGGGTPPSGRDLHLDPDGIEIWLPQVWLPQTRLPKSCIVGQQTLFKERFPSWLHDDSGIEAAGKCHQKPV